MSLRVTYGEFISYMNQRRDSYSVSESGKLITITFSGSSPMVVEKLGKPVTVTITAEREDADVIFKAMRVVVGEDSYDASPSSLESWLIEVTGRLPQ